MSEETYNHYNGAEKEAMTLRDYLAVDRTVMSNEVSFLSYIRTALTMVVAATALLKFFDVLVINILGWVFIASSVLLVVHGAARYEAMGRILHRLTGDMQNNPDTHKSGPARRLLLASQSLIGMFR
jgi:inner membrane protein YidH